MFDNQQTAAFMTVRLINLPCLSVLWTSRRDAVGYRGLQNYGKANSCKHVHWTGRRLGWPFCWRMCSCNGKGWLVGQFKIVLHMSSIYFIVMMNESFSGADVVGVNCLFDPTISLKAIAVMKEALSTANLNPYLMCQPIAYHTPDVNKYGLSESPEYPFGMSNSTFYSIKKVFTALFAALEPRLLTRWDMHKFAREAHEMGVRYLGGCCGMESYHIRAIAEEVTISSNRI